MDSFSKCVSPLIMTGGALLNKRPVVVLVSC